MKFSERIGMRTVKSVIQIKSIDDELKNGLWNIFFINYGRPMRDEYIGSIENSIFRDFIYNIWFNYLILPLDTIPSRKSEVILWLRDNFFKWNWYYVYDFIEFIVKNSYTVDKNKLIRDFNIVLKRELSGYRFIDDELVPISDENQIEEIQKVLDITKGNKMDVVSIHIQSALEKLSNKKNPDYRNSIKESISAVEAIAQIISGDTKAELKKALKIIREKIELHGALEQGFLKIYGYTSDGDGIRHALLEEPNLDVEDAIYMLTSCSAFVNYLIIKSQKAGINFNKE